MWFYSSVKFQVCFLLWIKKYTIVKWCLVSTVPRPFPSHLFLPFLSIQTLCCPLVLTVILQNYCDVSPVHARSCIWISCSCKILFLAAGRAAPSRTQLLPGRHKTTHGLWIWCYSQRIIVVQSPTYHSKNAHSGANSCERWDYVKLSGLWRRDYHSFKN